MSMDDHFPSNLESASPCSIAYNMDIITPFPLKREYVVAETMLYTKHDISFSFEYLPIGRIFDWKWNLKPEKIFYV